MPKFIRWCVVSLLLTVIALPVWAQDDGITLEPVTDTTFALTGVVPEGWKALGNGLYQRGQSATDPTLIALQSGLVGPDQIMQALLPQLGLTEPPEAVGGYASAVLEWTLYKVDVKTPTATIVVDFGLAEDEVSGRTYIAFLQTTADEYDALHKAVFQPMLEAFAPYVETVDESVPYTQEEVSFSNGDISLAGTLTLPEGNGPYPAVVLVSGSGPQDRDETIGQMKPFRLLADGLTRAGMAVLRYDDRGIAKSTGDFDTATTADFASDAAAAVDYLLTHDDIDPAKVGVLGHSEGGNVTAMLAASNDDLAFIISMAGPAVSGADILLLQNERILEAEDTPAEVINLQLKFLPKLFALIQAKDADGIRQLTLDTFNEQVKYTPEDQLQELGDLDTYAKQQADSAVLTYNTDWFRFFLTYNPAEDWAKAKLPILAIFGGLDTQVPSDQNAPAFEAAMQQAGNTEYQVTILPDANHLMQAATTGSPSEYGELDAAFTADFIPTITAWLTEQGILPGA